MIQLIKLRKRLKIIKLWFSELSSCWPFVEDGNRHAYLKKKQELGYSLSKQDQRFLQKREEKLQGLQIYMNLRRELTEQGLPPPEVGIKEFLETGIF